MLTTSEACAALSISRTRLMQLIASGRLQAVKHGRDYMIEESEIEQFVKLPPGRPRKETDANETP